MKTTKGPSNYQVLIANIKLLKVPFIKVLNIYLHDKLLWSDHLRDNIRTKLTGGVYAINRLKHIMPYSVLKMLYFTLIHPYLSYGCVLWGDAHTKFLRSSITLQKKLYALFIIPTTTPQPPLYSKKVIS